MPAYDLETMATKSRLGIKDRIMSYRRRGCFNILSLLVLLSSCLLVSSAFFIFYDHNTITSHTDKIKSIYNTYSGNSVPRANATIISLVRNDELWKMVSSIRDIEDRFNNKYHYDWVFLNEEEFTEEFKTVTTSLVSGETKYGIIPKEQWSYPENLDMEKYEEAKQKLVNNNVIYGGLDSYRHMCRYNSGFFFHHPLLQEYKWYWRVEPNIKLYCDVNYDPFEYMAQNNKTYGFTIALEEVAQTIPTLWKETMEYVNKNPQTLAENNLHQFITDGNMKDYNMCHFWSNFEIADMDFFRGEAYQNYFNHLDKTNKFFYERWGDAPIHSIAVSLFLDKSQVHLFQDMGYYHNPYASCPTNMEVWKNNRCSCDFNKDFTFSLYSCAPRYYDLQSLEKPTNWAIKSKFAAPLIEK